jgi:hypothetical protein
LPEALSGATLDFLITVLLSQFTDHAHALEDQLHHFR